MPGAGARTASRPAGEIATIGGRLEHARRRRFVGRRCELHLFQEALTAEMLPFSILYLHGSGGVGKTALLKRFAAAAEDARVPVATVDLRHVGPSTTDLMEAVRGALPVFDGAATPPTRRSVLLLDTYEAAADGWVRERLVPALPAEVLVVLAGRKPPGLEWSVDPGWRELVRVVRLDNLGSGDCQDFLVAVGVPERLHPAAIGISHGHPLALALLAELVEQQGSAATVGLVHNHDLVRTLLERFASGIPDHLHRQALEACAFVRALTEPVLRAALDLDDAGELFSWLRTVSVVEESARGLVVHELARDVLAADLGWRDPQTFRRVRRRILSHITAELPTAHGRRQQQILFDILYLHRTRSELAPHAWDAVDRVEVEPLRPEDRAAVLEMTTRHEGAESARWAEFWLDRQPAAFSGFRGGDELLGFACQLELSTVAPTDRSADPATRSVWAYAQRDHALDARDSVTFMRFIMDAEHYQSPSRAFDHRVTIVGRNYLANSRLAWDLLAVRHPYALATEFEYFDYPLAPEAGYTVGGLEFDVYAHDWRRRPVAAWAHLMGQRALAEPGKTVQPGADPGGELSRPQFDAAVKDALRNLARPALLVDSPLLCTRLAGRAQGTQAAARVAAAVQAAARALAVDPRDHKLFHAVDRTYLRPEPSQERAAKLLGLPFSTYRRHLTAGASRIADALWAEAYPMRTTAG